MRTGRKGKKALRYENVRKAVFVERISRFSAVAETEDGTELVHVKNTGRLGELLFPGAAVYLTEARGAERRTRYDLIAAEDAAGKLFNVDSTAPNRAMREFLETQGYDRVIPEYRYGSSRLDFAMWKEGRGFLTEVKGCTLIRDGAGWFPDAPTARGAKHLRELAAAAKTGWTASAAFVIQTEDVFLVRPNARTDPDFARAWREAEEAGVLFEMHPTRVTPDGMTILR